MNAGTNARLAAYGKGIGIAKIGGEPTVDIEKSDVFHAVHVATGIAAQCLLHMSVTGEVICLDLSNAHTAGGICGKLKEGEGPIIGRVENCYVNANVSAPYDAGGIAGIQDGGGYLSSCFAASTVLTTAESGTVGHAGGIAGSFNAGETLKDSVAVQRSITGLQGTDKIVGQLDDEAATNITGNLSWKGTALLGNEPIEQPIVWQDIYAEDLQSQETYEALDWDFTSTWGWNASLQQPVLQGFAADVFTAVDYRISGTHIISRAQNTAMQNESTKIVARVVSDSPVQSVSLYYGYDAAALDTKVTMTQSGDTYTATIPTTIAGDLFYYIKASTGSTSVTKPYDKSIPIVLTVDDGTIKGEPSQITRSTRSGAI